MDLAKYCVNAVLVEGRSVRAVAAATGRSKSWVHRHVALYRVGGDEALTPLRVIACRFVCPRKSETSQSRPRQDSNLRRTV